MARELIYWDSAAFLGLLNKAEDSDKCSKCEDVWISAQKGKIMIVTSTLTVAEVIYMKGARKLDPKKRPLVNNFFRQNHLSIKPLTRRISELARDVVWDTIVKPKDAVHVATAAFYKVGTLHTFDGDLLDLKTIDVDGFVVMCRMPYAPRQMELALEEPLKIPALEDKRENEEETTD